MLSKDKTRARPQFAANDHTQFDRICARRLALMAHWATTVLDLEDMQAYAQDLTQAAAQGEASILARIREDFHAAGIDVMDEVLQDRMVALLRSAADELRRADRTSAHHRDEP